MPEVQLRREFGEGEFAVTGIDIIEPVLPRGDLDNNVGTTSLQDAYLALKIAVGLEIATPEILALGVGLRPRVLVIAFAFPANELDHVSYDVCAARVPGAPGRRAWWS